MEPEPRLALGDCWESITEAKDAVRAWLRATGQAAKRLKDNEGSRVLICPDKELAQCPFRIRINKSQKGNQLTVFEEHSCPSSTHFKTKSTRSIPVIAADPIYEYPLRSDYGFKATDLARLEFTQFGHRLPSWTS